MNNDEPYLPFVKIRGGGYVPSANCVPFVYPDGTTIKQDVEPGEPDDAATADTEDTNPQEEKVTK